MSQENVERVRRGYALFNAGDADEWLALFSPDVVLTLSGVFPWESFRAEPRELVDRGDSSARSWISVRKAGAAALRSS